MVKLIGILKKQGGKELLRQYWQGGGAYCYIGSFNSWKKQEGA